MFFTSHKPIHKGMFHLFSNPFAIFFHSSFDAGNFTYFSCNDQIAFETRLTIKDIVDLLLRNEYSSARYCIPVAKKRKQMINCSSGETPLLLFNSILKYA